MLPPYQRARRARNHPNAWKLLKLLKMRGYWLFAPAHESTYFVETFAQEHTVQVRVTSSVQRRVFVSSGACLRAAARVCVRMLQALF
jgi:hypothetical protein